MFSIKVDVIDLKEKINKDHDKAEYCHYGAPIYGPQVCIGRLT